jgi:hypothetical protein
MTHASRSLLIRSALVLALVSDALSWALPARAMEGAALERGTAIIDPFALRELDLGEHRASGNDRAGFGLRPFIPTARPDSAPILGDELFALPSMAPVRQALDDDFERYLAKHKASLPAETIGVGLSFDWQLFDRELLYSPRVRFVLAGIVNRMDRAYVSPDACGEIRLIYRLTRLDQAPVGETANSPRLPMTLNVILRAKGEQALAPGGGAMSCKAIAQRWLAIADWPENGVDLANRLMAPGGPLELIEPVNIDRIETNLQIAHAPKSAMRDFRTDYLMKVFRYNARTHAFDEAPMENQIDRDRIMSDDKLRADFKTWLLDPKNFGELDRGTILIPDEFLARSVIAPTPVGFVSSELQPAFGMVQGEGDNPVFTEKDVVSALERADSALQNIHSPAGFERRLNDVGCGGCHQTRGIGGFHFPGVDWMAAKPSNSTVVPASPHFFGDQVRRRDILTAFRDGRPPDFSRGFASRPQTRDTTELAGTEYEDGWGSHCYEQRDSEAENDKSFRGWTCAEGLSCQIASPATRMGMCFIKTR